MATGNPELPEIRQPLTWNDLPRIVATLLVVGLISWVVVAFSLCPQFGEGSEEARCRYYPRLCREAREAVAAVPREQRLDRWPVLGRVPPNIVVVDLSSLHESHTPVRVALTEPDYEIVRDFVPRNIDAPLSAGQDDYNSDTAKTYLEKINAQRRRQWSIAITTWLALWSFFSWRQLRKPQHRQPS